MATSLDPLNYQTLNHNPLSLHPEDNLGNRLTGNPKHRNSNPLDIWGFGVQGLRVQRFRVWGFGRARVAVRPREPANTA